MLSWFFSFFFILILGLGCGSGRPQIQGCSLSLPIAGAQELSVLVQLTQRKLCGRAHGVKHTRGGSDGRPLIQNASNFSCKAYSLFFFSSLWMTFQICPLTILASFMPTFPTLVRGLVLLPLKTGDCTALLPAHVGLRSACFGIF